MSEKQSPSSAAIEHETGNENPRRGDLYTPEAGRQLPHTALTALARLLAHEVDAPVPGGAS